MIDSMRKTFSAKELCDAFEVSRSSYYAWKRAKPTKRSIENRQIVEAINLKRKMGMCLERHGFLPINFVKIDVWF